MVVTKHDVWLIALDPTVGNEMKKTRPCLILSPDEMNLVFSTYVVAPMTSKSKPFPFRVETTFLGKRGWIALDQIKTVSKLRMVKRLGKVSGVTSANVNEMMKRIFIEE